MHMGAECFVTHFCPAKRNESSGNRLCKLKSSQLLMSERLDRSGLTLFTGLYIYHTSKSQRDGSFRPCRGFRGPILSAPAPPGFLGPSSLSYRMTEIVHTWAVGDSQYYLWLFSINQKPPNGFPVHLPFQKSWNSPCAGGKGGRTWLWPTGEHRTVFGTMFTFNDLHCGLTVVASGLLDKVAFFSYNTKVPFTRPFHTKGNAQYDSLTLPRSALFF